MKVIDMSFTLFFKVCLDIRFDMTYFENLGGPRLALESIRT